MLTTGVQGGPGAVKVLATGSMSGGPKGRAEFRAVAADLAANGVREAIVYDSACSQWWKLRIGERLAMYIGTPESFTEWEQRLAASTESSTTAPQVDPTKKDL